MTCTCAEFITVSSTPKLQDSDLNVITSGLTKVISDLLIDTCGTCEEYKTKLIYSNKSHGNEVVFPVTKTSYGQSAYSKFVPVIKVPGVVVITRKTDLSMVLTQVASGSVLQSWPISVVTIVMAMLAGIVIWFLVRISEHFQIYMGRQSREKRLRVSTFLGLTPGNHSNTIEKSG